MKNEISPQAIAHSDDADAALIARGRDVIRIEADALAKLESSLGDNFVAACKAIYATRRQLVVTGMGKSGHIARKVAATFAATGTPATFVHPAEAGHGDLGMIVDGDVLLVLSNSGNTAELRAVLTYARRLSIPIVGVASRPSSVVMDYADIQILLPAVREACTVNFAPTTSTAMQLAFGDALAMTVMDMRGVSKTRLGAIHPSGSIGIALMPVRDVMHGPESLPLVSAGARMSDVISVMTTRRHGIAGVVDAAGGLIGVITDGDVRRNFHALDISTAADVMSHAPKSVPGGMLASEVLVFLTDAKITVAFVFDETNPREPRRPIGVVHIHDLLRFGLQ